MHHDHVRAGQLFTAGHPLPHEAAVMGNELQVEARDEDAGVALAAGRSIDGVLPATEREVGGLHGVEQHRRVDLDTGRVDEGGVTLQLGESHRRRQRVDHRLGQVGQHVLCVVELRSGQVGGVAADVGHGQAALLRLAQRCMVRHSDRHSGKPTPAPDAGLTVAC